MAVSKLTNPPSQKGVIDKINEVIDNLGGGGSVDIDNKSITTNSDDELQTVGVIDQNNTANAIKTWTGTKAQYEAIVTKDSNTLYNIIDDADVTFQLLELIYPVGSIYIGTMSVCPLQTLGLGTWELVAEDRVLQGAGTRGSVGATLAESLPNIKGEVHSVDGASSKAYTWYNSKGGTGAFSGTPTANATVNGANLSLTYNSTINVNGVLDFNAHNSNSTYQDDAPVQQDAYLVNIWKRIS